MPKIAKPLTKPELCRRARLRQVEFLRASWTLAEINIKLDEDMADHPRAWPEGCAYPVLPELRDHVELARRTYERLCERIEQL